MGTNGMGNGPDMGTDELGYRDYQENDCSAVLGRMFFFLDNELEQADCDQIQRHLDECGPCLAKYDLERTVKQLVARSCSEVAPEGLRQRVMLSIRQVQVRIERTDEV